MINGSILVMNSFFLVVNYIHQNMLLAQ